MKRSALHALFGLCALLLITSIGWHWVQLRAQQRLDATLATLPDTLTTPELPELDEDMRKLPAVQLALANALAKGAQLEQAEAVYSDLIRKEEASDIAIAAQFNLANAYLRAGMDPALSSSRAVPLLELAKQRYRNLLRTRPNHWGARFNLERTLRLAPEGADSAAEDIDPVKSVRVIVPGFEKQDLP